MKMIKKVLIILIFLCIYSNLYSQENDILIEIPIGTIEKWEYNNELRTIIRDSDKNSKPRNINYIAYPFNYGIVINTFNKEDGDPLDAVVFGSRLEKGDTIKAKAIAVVKTIDSGEKDHKIIFAHHTSPIYKVNGKDELEKLFPGVIEIVSLFFENYKRNKSNVIGVADEKLASKLIFDSKIQFNRLNY